MRFMKNIFKSILVILIISLAAMNILCAQQEEDAKNDKVNKKGNTGPGYSIFKGTLADLTWPEVKKAADENALVLLPVAVIEEHGPHMCLGTDTYLSYQRSLALKEKLEALQIKAVVAPPVYWGIMQLTESGAFPGSFTVSPATMKALIADVFSNLQRWGFRYFYCVGHHGDRIHRNTLKEAMAEAKEKLSIVFYNDREQEDRSKAPEDKQFISGRLFEPDFHAGASETSAMLEYYPALVDLEIVKTLKPESWFQPLGYVGDPINYRKLNMRGLDSVEVDYYAECIAEWLKVQKD